MVVPLYAYAPLMRTILFFLICFLFIFPLSHAQTSDNPFSSQIKQTLTRTKIGAETLYAKEVLIPFYEQRGYESAWNQTNTSSLLKAINESKEEGLRPELYHLKTIKDLISQKSNDPSQKASLDILLSDAFLLLASHYRYGFVNSSSHRLQWFVNKKDFNWVFFLNEALARGAIATSLENLLPDESRYTLLRKKLAEYQALPNQGAITKVSSGPKLKVSSQNKRVLELKKRLDELGYFSVSENELDIFDEKVEEALKKFQSEYGLTVDGEVGPVTLDTLNTTTAHQLCKIGANLDRHRSLLPKLEKKYILVNIPDFKLSVFQNEKIVFDSRVIVGRVNRKSPLLDDQVEYLVFSPKWHVPTSIAVKDKLPDIQKDPAYLNKMGFKVYQEGKLVDPETVDWSKVTKENFSYHLAQEPGGGNALGRVKFMFPNKHEVYLHDTPSKSLFERERRTFSSGCIRLEKPVELAKYILDNKSEWDEESIKKAMFSGNQQNVKLDEALPIHLAYLTAWMDEDNQLQLRPDVYGFDKVYEKNICE